MVGPGATLDASPWAGGLLIVATAAVEEAHVTVAVRSAVVPSEYSPVAVNCCTLPIRMEGVCGLTVIAVSVAFVTVRLHDPETVPRVALITLLPLASLVVIPLLPGVSLTVATFGPEELQWTELVRSCVEPSVNVPAAVNAWFDSIGIATLAGFTMIETTDAGVTLSGIDPLVLPTDAVIVAVPVAKEVPSALEFTVATVGFPELHVAEAVRS